MSAVVLDNGVKPEMWPIEPSLVAPEWGWFWKTPPRRSYIFWEGMGKATDFGQAKNQTFIFNQNTGWRNSKVGLGIDTMTTDVRSRHNYVNTGDDAELTAPTALMIVAGFIFKGVQGGDGRLVSKGQIEWDLGHSSGDDLRFRIRLDGDSISVNRGALTVGNYYDAVGVWTGANINSYLNGIVTGSDVAATGTPDSGSAWPEIFLGASSAINDTSTNGNFNISYLHIWPSEPIPASIVAKQFARDPFGPFRMFDDIPVLGLSVAFTSANLALGDAAAVLGDAAVTVLTPADSGLTTLILTDEGG